MFGFESLSGTAQAVLVIGAVLVEALLLYVGYGALERAVGPKITEALRGG
ncbi:MAG: hypothetical protein ABEH80_03330 [Halobaculum sp.]|jgi:hypothetical protein